MSHLLDVIQEGLAEIDTFDATLAAPAVGSGGGIASTTASRWTPARGGGTKMPTSTTGTGDVPDAELTTYPDDHPTARPPDAPRRPPRKSKTKARAARRRPPTTPSGIRFG